MINLSKSHQSDRNNNEASEEMPSMKDQANGPVSPTEFSELTQKMPFDNI